MYDNLCDGTVRISASQTPVEFQANIFAFSESPDLDIIVFSVGYSEILEAQERSIGYSGILKIKGGGQGGVTLWPPKAAEKNQQ